MAVSEQRLASTEFVQHWVNSLPTVCEAEHGETSLLSSSCSSYSSSGFEQSQHASYSVSHEGSHGHRTSVPSHSAAQRTPPDAIAGTSSAERTVASSSATDKRQALRRKDSRLSWMHSNYSSFNSETSSIDILLEERKGNPEQVLMNLGFGVEDKTIAARLPSRFLSQRTSASGIDMENFIKGHPELNHYMATETALAMGELYSRLPQYYRQVSTNDQHTSLHKQFSSSSLDVHSDQASVPLTLHKNDDGSVFASILTKSNTEQLVKQGFYSEYSAQTPSPVANQSSVSSISTHDCTIDSVDVPSPIVLNNSVSSESRRNPFISTQSSGSDSVFSSSESFTADAKLRGKLEAIREKTLPEVSDEDMEEGISFVCRRRSDSDLKRPDIVVEEEPEEKCSIHKKRKAFSRMKSQSFDEERLTQMLKDHLRETSGAQPTASATPVIVTTGTSEDDSSEPLLPKQCDGMLQVMFNPESFDSIDSDTGTLVPSPYASPYQGMSPNTSRNNSLSVLPAMESFELEEVQSCTESNTAHSSLQRRRERLQRSISQRSDSDSSGIADIDCKSSHGQNDCPTSKASSLHLELPSSSNKSLSSSNQTLSSVNSTRTATTSKTVLPVCGRPRRSSDSDASDMRYHSVSSSLSNACAPKPSVSTQTPEFKCPCCGSGLDGSLSSQSRVIKEWQINNLPYINDLNITSGDGSMVTDRSGCRHSSAGGKETDSCTKSSDLESAGYSSDEFNGASPSEQDRRVDEICSEMTRDLTVLKELIAKYGISTKEVAPTSSRREEAVKQELASNVRAVKSVLLPDPLSTQSDSSTSSADSVNQPAQSHTSRQRSPGSPSLPNWSSIPSHQEQTCPPADQGRNTSPGYAAPRVAVNGLPPVESDSLQTPNNCYRRSASPLLTSQSTSNGYAPSSVSSSYSRLSDQLRLTERKCEYESVADEETGGVREAEISADVADEG